MTSQVLCFQHHSRPWDQNNFDKRSNVLNYHEHQSAQCHITRSTISGPMRLLIGRNSSDFD